VVDERLPWGRLALLAAAVFAAVTTEVLPVGLLPQLSTAFAVSEARIGWWMSGYALVVAVGAVPVTAVLARWPRRRALLVLLVTYALSNALVVAAEGRFWLALVARLLGGLAHAGVFSVVVATATTLAPARRTGRAIAAVSAGSTLALAFGVPLGTALGGAVGWRWAFVSVSALLVLLAVATAVVVPAETGGDAPGAAPGRAVLAALRGRVLLLVAVTTAVFALAHFSAYTYVTPLMLRAGVAAGAVSLVLLGYGVAGFAGVLAAGALADHHPVATLRVALALTVLSLAALSVFARSGTGTAVTIVVWGATFAAMPSLLQTLAMRSTSSADAAPAVVNAMFNVGISVGAAVGGLFLSSGRTVALTGAAAVVAGLSLALTLGLRPSRTGVVPRQERAGRA
jgi:DHA1 family inner membrane transport protein